MKYLLLCGSMITAVIGQFFLKKGINISPLSHSVLSIVKTIFSPLVFVGFLMYGMSSIFWLFVLQKFPLSVAYPALSITYVIIVVLSAIILNEPITTFKILGLSLIIFGVYFIFK